MPRIELRAIDPPCSVQGATEQQIKAERDRRTAILTAESVKQSTVLMAEGERQSVILRAESRARSTILRAQGEARAILQVFDAIHRGSVDSKLLSYEYIGTLPQITNSSSSKLRITPTEMTAALNAVTKGLGDHGGDGESGADFDSIGKIADVLAVTALLDIGDALADVKGVTNVAIDGAKTPGCQFGRHLDPDTEVR